jgi:L-histidine Nalpha-methyltransferase
MSEKTNTAPLFDQTSERGGFLGDVAAGLALAAKELPCKYFYDQRGSELFDAICTLDEYYPTRTELAIMREHGAAMAALVGPHAAIIEYGSGSSIKTRVLIDRLDEPEAYLPVDISCDHMDASMLELADRHPNLLIMPICADFTRAFFMPDLPDDIGRRIVYFPGSTIGNFGPDEAVELLANMAGVAGPGGGLLIGVDLQKDLGVLEAAYNDARGVTAAFNLNLLRRINDELGGDFDLEAFAHRAVYNQAEGCIEMRLTSLRDQTVRLGGRAYTFAAGEFILTERSHKYTVAGFADLARRAGFTPRKVWTDPRELFSVQYFERPTG